MATSAAVMLVNAATAALAQAGGRAGCAARTSGRWGVHRIGAAAGSPAATALGDTALRLPFAAYLLVTITDSLLREGFLSVAHRPRPEPLGRATITLGGMGIGLVAAALGVGGSVMTVPLLRRRGLPMAEATALANPSSVPVAVAGTLVYAVAPTTTAGPGQLGYVDSPPAPPCSSARCPPSPWPGESPAASPTASTPSPTSCCSCWS
ncbi:TSUP family transporter [Streptomyces tricolor]|nr:TSUP family transporter [Streptomyces tricolor]